METTQQQLLTSQLNVDEKPNCQFSEPLITREPIPDTPFLVITMNNKVFITYGRYRLSPENISDNPTISPLNHAQEWLKKNIWHTILLVIGIITDNLVNDREHIDPIPHEKSSLPLSQGL